MMRAMNMGCARMPLLAAMATLSLSSVASAASDVTFAYACRANHRGLELIPSGQHTYRIIGPYESQIVTACSPSDRSRCKTWRLYRFDIDCNGTRVPWMDIVGAAAAMTHAPAFVQNDQLTIRMGAWWSGAQDRWSQRPVWPDGSGKGGAKWVPSSGASNEVQMPPGFAPIVGLQARIGDGAGPRSSTASGDMAANEPPPSTATSPSLPVSDIRRTVATKPATPSSTKRETPTTSAKSSSTTSDGKTTNDTPRGDSGKSETQSTASMANADDASKPEASSAEKAPPPTAVVLSNSTQPKILNAPGAAPHPDPSTAKSSVPPVETGMPPPAETGALPEKAPTAPAAGGSPDKRPSETQQAVAEPPPLPSTPVVTTPVDGKSNAVGNEPKLMGMLSVILATALAAAYFWTRRNDLRAPRPVAARDFAAVPGPVMEPLMQPKPNTLSTRPRLEAPSISASSADEPGRDAPAEHIQSAPIAECIPSNRTEALLVLGAGPDSSDAVLKKIADGLRQSWHPDLARSAEDRIARERRMVQINLAWEILSAKPGDQAA